MLRTSSIEGPGTISGAEWIGVFLENGVRLSVKDVVFRGTDVGILGTYSGRQRVTLENVTFEDNREWSLSARSLVATNLVVHGNGGPFYAITAASARIVGGDVSGNAGTGIQGNKIRLENVTVTVNAGIGVDAGRSMMLIGSTVAGNGPADMRSPRRPRLVSSTCGHSIDEDGGTWGECAGD